MKVFHRRLSRCQRTCVQMLSTVLLICSIVRLESPLINHWTRTAERAEMLFLAVDAGVSWSVVTEFAGSDTGDL